MLEPTNKASYSNFKGPWLRNPQDCGREDLACGLRSCAWCGWRNNLHSPAARFWLNLLLPISKLAREDLKAWNTEQSQTSRRKLLSPSRAERSPHSCSYHCTTEQWRWLSGRLGRWVQGFGLVFQFCWIQGEDSLPLPPMTASLAKLGWLDPRSPCIWCWKAIALGISESMLRYSPCSYMSKSARQARACVV